MFQKIVKEWGRSLNFVWRANVVVWHSESLDEGKGEKEEQIKAGFNSTEGRGDWQTEKWVSIIFVITDILVLIWVCFNRICYFCHIIPSKFLPFKWIVILD